MYPVKKTVIPSIESLEHRSMLAATADIVFVVDESDSQEIGFANDGQAIRPWVSLIARQSTITSRHL